MKNTAHVWVRGLLFVALLACGPALAAKNTSGQPSANDEENAQPFGEWTVSQSQGVPIFTTHGTRVWGHEFGFVDNPVYCVQHIVWIEWSSMKARPADFKKVRNVSLKIRAAGETIPIHVEISDAIPFTQDLTVIALTHFNANDRFLDLIQRAKEINVRVIGPPALLKLLDVTEDTFPVKGFAAARARADTMCALSGKPK